MAGSPAYLALLDTLPKGLASWKTLDTVWAQVEAHPQPETLRRLAGTALSIVTVQAELEWIETINDAKRLHIAKNAGYAGAENPDPWANFRLSQAFGVDPFRGVLVRLTDKYSRIQSLRRDPHNERVGESLLDTTRDLAAYALIAICISEEDAT
jgi:hypothetical protein